MLFLDIETLDFFGDVHIKILPRGEQLSAMRFGLAVTYNAATDEWREWHGFAIVEMVEYICNERMTVCGWNIVDFDLPVIAANLERIGHKAEPLRRVPVLDLFGCIRTDTGRWYSLDAVAQANLERGKIADGQTATEWLRGGDPNGIRRAAEYCRDDVNLVVALHSYLLSDKPLFLPGRPERGELNDILWTLDGHERIVGEDGALGTR